MCRYFNSIHHKMLDIFYCDERNEDLNQSDEYAANQNFIK